MSALRLINETSGTSVTSLSATDIFSADFDIYKIVVETSNPASGGYNYIRARFINASGSEVASGYDNAYLTMKSASAFSETRGTNETEIQDLGINTSGVNPAYYKNTHCVFYVFNPFSSSSYSFGLYQGTGTYDNFGLFYETNGKGITVLKNTASMKGLKIWGSGNGSFDLLLMKTYGLRVDNG